MTKVYEYQQIFIHPLEYSENLLDKILSNLLNVERYDHVMRVLETANKLMDLCNCPQQEREKIKIAVLLHDLAKGMNETELEKYAKIYNISLVDVPGPVYHAIVGAWIAENFLNITDKDILDAVYYHTTGSVNFINNKVGAILYLADYLDPGKGKDESGIYELVSIDLLLAMKVVVKKKIISVITKEKILDQQSLSFYHRLISY